jgi:hypothetical protein
MKCNKDGVKREFSCRALHFQQFTCMPKLVSNILRKGGREGQHGQYVRDLSFCTCGQPDDGRTGRNTLLIV